MYAAPFPYTATLDDLTAFFAAHAPVNCVRQRRHLTSKDFKGSCFVEFASVDAATQARARAPACLTRWRCTTCEFCAWYKLRLNRATYPCAVAADVPLAILHVLAAMA